MKQCNHARLFLLFAIVFLVAFAGGTIDLAAKHRLIKATRESNEVLVSQVDSLIQDCHNLAVENHSWEESYTRLSGEYTKLQDEKKLVDEERSRVEEAKTKAEEARAKADRDNARLDGKVQVLASQSKDLTNKVAILSVTNTELVSTNKELDTKVLRLDYEKTDLEIRNADLEWRNKFLKARYEPNITLGQNDLFAFWGGELYGRSLELLGKEFSINQLTLYRDCTYYYLIIDKLKEVIAADSSGVRGASSPPICVFTQPGVIAETTIPFSFKRKARVFVYILIPAFEIR